MRCWRDCSEEKKSHPRFSEPCLQHQRASLHDFEIALHPILHFLKLNKTSGLSAQKKKVYGPYQTTWRWFLQFSSQNMCPITNICFMRLTRKPISCHKCNQAMHHLFDFTVLSWKTKSYLFCRILVVCGAKQLTFQSVWPCLLQMAMEKRPKFALTTRRSGH